MKKKIMLLCMINVFILSGMLCYISYFAGFFITKYLSGRADGKQGIIMSIIIPWRHYQVHLHHWFIALIAGGVLLINRIYIISPEVSYGLISSVIFQGVCCYEDWHRIIKRRDAPLLLAQQLFLTSDKYLESLCEHRQYMEYDNGIQLSKGSKQDTEHISS
jgi:hypothetical protein